VLAGLVALVVLTTAGIVGVLAARARAARARALPVVARRAGLRFSETDPFNCVAAPFPLLRAGDGRRVDNVMWRPGAPGHPRVFDYSYYDEYRDRSGRVRERWRHFTCALAQHDGAWPELQVMRERLVDRAVQKLGPVDIDLESEEFNRTFVVRCEDRKFATDLLSPEMMELLLDTRGKLELETRGRFVLLTTSRLEAAAMPGLLAVAERFLALVPPVVRELYPTYPAGHGTEDMPAPPERHRRAGPGAGLFGGLGGLGVAGPGRTPQRPPFEFAPPPDLRGRTPDPWDPTPGVEHDLDGRPLPPAPEDPWGRGRPASR